MNKGEYINELKTDIDNLVSEYRLNNYKSQAFAWKLNASFNRTFDEKYLWNRALFLATNSCFLLQNDTHEKTALKGLYESAEIYEYLSELPDISENFDRDYLLILSALCYDLSGYQSNAYCVADRINELELKTDNEFLELSIDNKIVEQVKLILLKKIPLAKNRLRDAELEQDFGYSVFVKAVEEWYDYLLKLENADYLSSLEEAYKYYLNTKNTYISHLLFLLKTRVKVFNEKSIWNNLNTVEAISLSAQWRKYVKLLAYDYYAFNAIKDINQRKSIFEFWTSQIRAIENGLIELDENFVVQMPTSAGKTFIAELSILKYLIKFPNKKCVYVAPFRALTSEKEIELSKYFSKLGFSVSSLSGSYEIDEFQDVILSDSDLLIATPEKIDLLLRLNPDFFTNVSFVVIDEGHIIGDISTRATLLEFLIIRLRIKIPEIKTLFISAVMPPENADEYSLWLSGGTNNVLRSLKFKDSSVSEEWEPTRKLISYFEWVGENGDITFQNVHTEDENTRVKQGAKLYSFLKHREFGNIPKKKNKKESAAALAYKFSEEGNTLVFCAQVPRIKSVANSFLQLLSDIDEVPERFQVDTNKKSAYYAELWFGSESYITNAIIRGIGIHYGDMPEQVRNAVEDDFRNGNLKVLLSTNTIGQGLNFPIKNLIFYETQINRINDTNIYIQFRDFWNIVGRAGRAGKETEGNIIFIINSNTDRRLYEGYINRANIEDADSLFFKVIDALENRVGYRERNFMSDLSILSETYLLDLLSEEIIGTEYEDIIEQIINNSLFKVQLDKRGINVEPIKQGFNRIFKSFEDDSTYEELSVFRMTGFSYKSNRVIDEFITQNIEELTKFVDADDYLSIVKNFLRLITINDIDELEDYKLDNLDIEPVAYYDIIEHWVTGTTIQDLIPIWEQTMDKEVFQFHIFISKALYYLYPWGFSSFLQILSYKLGIQFEELPENIKNLTSYIKYGLNNPTSCLARSIGIKSRQVSFFLFEQSNYLEGKDFIRWISNLTNNEIDSYDISIFDKQNLKDISLKLSPNSFRETINEFKFRIKGTYYIPEWSVTSRDVEINESLNYKRDVQNDYDPYAIIIMKDENDIGYVPREYSKLISSEIDIEDSTYNINVININEKESYNEIEVQMIKIE